MDGRGAIRAEAATWLLVAALAVGFVAWHWATLFQFPWKFDEGIYMQEATLQLQGQRLYVDIWSERPPFFSWMLAGAFALFGASVTAGRAVVLATAVLAIVAMAIIGRRVGGRVAGVAAAILFLTLPQLQGLAYHILIELPPVSFALLAVALLLEFQVHGRRGWLVLSALSFAVSLLIKPSAAPIYAPLVLLAWQGAAGSAPGWRRRLTDLALYHAAMAAPAVLVFLYYGPRVVLDHIVGTLFAMREAHTLSLADNWHALSAYLTDDNWGLGYEWLVALAALGCIALVVRQRRWLTATLAVWLGCVLAALMLHTPIRTHHLFLLMPTLIVPAAAAISEALVGLGALRAMGHGRRALVLACGLALIWGLVRLPEVLAVDWERRVESLAPADQTPLRLAAIAFIQEQAPPGSTILADDPMLAFKAERPIPPLLVAPSFKRVESDELNQATLQALVERHHPPVIAFWERRLERVPGWESWVRQHYILARAPEVDRRIYVAAFSPAPTPEQRVRTQEGLVYLSSRVRQLKVEPGGVLTVELLLAAEEAIAQDYTLTLNLLEPDGSQRWGQTDLRPVDDRYRTSAWLPGQRVMQRVEIHVAPEATPGEKVLTLGFYGPDVSLLEVFDPQGQALPHRQIPLAARPVVRWAPVTTAPVVAVMQQAELGGRAQLSGYTLTGDELRPNGELTVELAWQCLQEMETSYTAFVHLLDGAGALVAQSDARPAGGAFPTTGWVPGEYITDVHWLRLPEVLPAGDYRLAVGLYDLATGQRLELVKDGQPQGESHITLDTALRAAP